MSSNFEELADLLVKLVGKNDTAASVAGFLSTGYLPLNSALSGRYYDGGVPRGRITEIFGPESCGKTALATDIMIAAQRAGGYAIFLDHEHSWHEGLAVSRGLDVTKQWFYKKPKTFEEGVALFMQISQALRASKNFDKNAPIVVVFDSLASMVPQEYLEKDVTKINMRDDLGLSKATSRHFKVIAPLAEELDITVIFLNQIREKPGVMFGDPTTTPGGNAPKFFASVRIQLGATRLMKEDGTVGPDGKPEKIMIGSVVTARVIKNKIYRPFMRAKWKFTFRPDGTGFFDVAGSLVELLVAQGLIKKDGHYLVWNGKKVRMSNLIEQMRGHEDELNEILINAGVVAEIDEEAKAMAEAEGEE